MFLSDPGRGLTNSLCKILPSRESTKTDEQNIHRMKIDVKAESLESTTASSEGRTHVGNSIVTINESLSFPVRVMENQYGDRYIQLHKYGEKGYSYIVPRSKEIFAEWSRAVLSAYQSKVDEKAGINRMQGWIIGYLYRHSEEAVFQKDLEAEFQMARSTASGILQAMEKKGLITREPIPRDARLKRLVLTEKGMEFQMEIMENFDRIQKVLKSDIPQEKLECFLEVLDMIRENAQRECCLRDEN